MAGARGAREGGSRLFSRCPPGLSMVTAAETPGVRPFSEPPGGPLGQPVKDACLNRPPALLPPGQKARPRGGVGERGAAPGGPRGVSMEARAGAPGVQQFLEAVGDPFAHAVKVRVHDRPPRFTPPGNKAAPAPQARGPAAG